MGTNYYFYRKVCGHCGRGDEPIHIGKSSFGWCFSLHIYPEEDIHDLPDWQRAWDEPESIIKDEYGQAITKEDMLVKITQRGDNKTNWEKPPYGYANWRAFHGMNQSERGPNGLVRKRIGSYCQGHGSGTWDLCTHDFS